MEKYLQSGKGTEFCNKSFDNHLEENCIRRWLRTPYSQQGKSVAERKNRTLIERARKLVIHSGLSIDCFGLKQIMFAIDVYQRVRCER